MRKTILFVISIFLLVSCAQNSENYLDNSSGSDVRTGGVKMIPIDTPSGKFQVWTKRTGNNPDIKVLLLHGGPGFTHEYLEAFDSFFPAANIEYYYYDQLGSYYSDQPDDPDLWDLPRFVEEVEQVRQALDLDKDNFYLFGQSWGGLLAMEYALKYQQHLKGLVISNMVASVPAYNDYAEKVIMPAMDPEILAQIKHYEATNDYDDPNYMALLFEHHYSLHFLRIPPDDWPEPVKRSFKHMNPAVYVPMQGPSELGAGGKLINWDRTADLPQITVPTLSIGARYDTMEPAQMKFIANNVQQGRYLYCPQGSHLALYDDQEVFFHGLIDFIKDVDQGEF